MNPRRSFSPVPVLEQNGVRLIPTGNDRYRCKCPVHDGDRLSMAVGLLDGRWQVTCYACGFNGSAVDLVMAMMRIPLRAAFDFLEGGRFKDAAPVELHRREVLTVACDASGCGNTLDVEGRPYKVPGRTGGLWTTTAEDEAVYATSRGWEMSANAEFALCPECVA